MVTKVIVGVHAYNNKSCSARMPKCLVVEQSTLPGAHRDALATVTKKHRHMTHQWSFCGRRGTRP
jgi:negative regulator of sigma E activity